MRSADDTLAAGLARQARQLGLETATAQEADSEALLSFALAVLEELTARGLLPGKPEVGCWGRPRSQAN